MKRLNAHLVGTAMAVAAFFGAGSTMHASGTGYDDPISYSLTGTITPISGSSSSSLSLNVSTPVGSYYQTVSSPTTSLSLRISDYAGYPSMVDVTVNNVSAFTISVAIKPMFDAYLNGRLRSSFTVANVDGNGNVLTGSVTYHIPISMIRKWRGQSLYGATVATVASQTSLGESGSVVPVTVPVATSTSALRPSLEFGMGLAKNGMPMPELKVFTDYLPTWVYPDVPDMVQTTQSSTTTWVQAPQVTAIITTLAQYGTATPGPTLSVSFSLPGQESTPYVTYTISTVSYTSGANGGYSEQVSVQKTYVDNPTSYQTDVTTTITQYPPPGSNFPQYFAATVSYKDWHTTTTTTAPRNVSLTTTASNSSFVSAIYQVDDGNNNIATLTRYDYTLVANMTWRGTFAPYWLRSKVTEDYNGHNYVSTVLYWSSDNYEAGNTDPIGGTTWWTFSSDTGDNAGLFPGTVYSPWNNNVPVYNGSTTGCKVTQYGYGPDWSGRPAVTSKSTSVNGVTIASESTTYQFTGDAAADNETLSNGLNIVVATTTTSTSANATLQQIVKTYRPDNADTLFDGVPYSVKNTDGTMTAYAYERGTYNGTSFTVQAGGPDLQVTTFSGVVPGPGATTITQTAGGTVIDSIGMIANRSNIAVDIWARASGSSGAPADCGRFLAKHEEDLYTGTGTNTTLTYEQYVFDTGRLKSVTGSNGITSSTNWNGDQKHDSTDTLGRTHTYTYDNGGRLWTESVTGVSTAPFGSGNIPTILTTYGYDADNRTISIAVGPAGGEQVTTSTMYDKGGRTSQTTDSRGVTVTYQRSNGDQTVQENYGDGGTKITTLQPDGRKASVTGTAVVNEYYTYGVDSSTGRTYTTTNLGTTSGRSKTDYFDYIGRTAETDTNAFGTNGSSTPIVTKRNYDSNGRLTKVQMAMSGSGGGALSADSLTFYDALGAVTDQGLDVNSDGALTAVSTDRFAHYDITVGANRSTSGTWVKTVNTLYTVDNANTNYQTETDVQVGGFPANVQSASISYDRYSNATSDVTTVDRTNHWTLQTTTAPDGTAIVKYMVGDLLLAEATLDSTGSAVAWTSYSYDAQGRLSATQDSKVGTATHAYYTNSTKLNYERDATQTIVTTYSTYDGVGRPTKILDAIGNDVQTIYNARGQVTQQSGAVALPVQYDYNAYGERTAMRTYRNGLTGLADWTNWVYDDNTGWLKNKVDAAATRDSSGNVTNAAGHQVSYDYSYDFVNKARYVTRTAARGTIRQEKRSLVTGDLLSVTYTDEAGITTPTVSSTYTRDGQLYTVTDATGTRNLIYSQGALSAEALDTSFYRGAQNGLVSTVSRESATSTTNHTILGRYAGYSLGYVLTTGSTADLNDEGATSITYDNASRVKTVTAAFKAQGSRPAASTVYTYTYNTSYAPAAQWYQVQQGGFTLTRGYESHRNLVNSVKATSATGTVTDFEVTRDGTGRTQYIVQSGYAYADYGSPIHMRYTFNPNGSLQNAGAYLGGDGTSTANPLPGMGLAYTYDSFGNRATASVDSSTVTYTDGAGNSGGNNLNQVGTRGTLPVHVSGTAAAGSTVTANGVAATFVGNYWDAALPVSSSGAYYSQLPVSASNGSQSTSATLAALLRPSSEAFTYDADGNLKTDSLWKYTWDAEDRLIKIASSDASVSFGAPAYSISFVYDYLGRRVQKTVLLNNVKVWDHKFVYQGPLLIAEIDASTNQLVQSYTWGVDRSGSIGGAGGIDGLLLITAETSNTLAGYNVSYDASGNVVALISTADGSLAGAYEYDPFGQLVRRQGAMAKSNPFQYSTKFTDVETGQVYYGRRYYDPTMGRFINRDPAEESGGLNLYGFVGADPVDAVDPFGLSDADDVVKLDKYEVRGNKASGGIGGFTSNGGPYFPTDLPSIDIGSLSLTAGVRSPVMSGYRAVAVAVSKKSLEAIRKARLHGVRDALKDMSEAWKKSHDWLQRSFTHNPYADRLDALNAIVEAVDAPVPLPDDSAPANMFGIGPRVRDPYGDPAEMAARRQEEQTVQTGMRFLGKVGEEMAIQIVLIPVTEFTFEFTFARIAAQLADLAAAERPLITVIGSLRDTEPFIGREGFNVLNVPKDVYESMTPEEFDALNTRWLQSAINRGDEIWLVTDPIKHAELMETLGTNSRYLDLELPLLEQTGSATAKNAYYLNWVE